MPLVAKCQELKVLLHALQLHECVDDCDAAADGPSIPLEPITNFECDDDFSQHCETRAPSQPVSQMPAPPL